jgi:hypothetical protein
MVKLARKRRELGRTMNHFRKFLLVGFMIHFMRNNNLVPRPFVLVALRSSGYEVDAVIATEQEMVVNKMSTARK